MVPIELVWFTIVFLFGLIGTVRGYLKELGVTTVMVMMLFAIITFEGRLAPIVAQVTNWWTGSEVAVWVTATWVVALIGVAFVSYHGQTLAFEGSLPKGALGTGLNLGAGLVNGYLIAGSLWFYIDRLGYPWLGIKPEQLSSLAKALVDLSPPSLLAPYLLYVAVFLMLMRVIR